VDGLDKLRLPPRLQQQQNQKRTFNVLPKPDIFRSYRQRICDAPGLVELARYTGQESNETRKAIANSPPDLLLTNFPRWNPLCGRSLGMVPSRQIQVLPNMLPDP
jgi:hypothetical protein